MSLVPDDMKTGHVVDTKPSYLSISNNNGWCNEPHKAIGKLVSLFKVHLAGERSESDLILLPNRFSKDDVIRDYLREISQFTLEDIKRRFGTLLSMGDIQWALIIPAFWDKRAKHRVKRCAEMASMIEVLPFSTTSVNGGSRHLLLLIFRA